MSPGRTVVEVSEEDHAPEPDLGSVDVIGNDPPHLAKKSWPRRPDAKPHTGTYVAAESIGVVTLIEHGVSKGARERVHRDAGQGIRRNRTLPIEEPDGAHPSRQVVIVSVKCRIFEYEGLCKGGPQHRDFSLETYRSTSQPPKVNEQATFLSVAGAFEPGETAMKTDGGDRWEPKVRNRVLCATVRGKRDEQGKSDGAPGQLGASHISEEHSLDTRGT